MQSRDEKWDRPNTLKGVGLNPKPRCCTLKQRDITLTPLMPGQ